MNDQYAELFDGVLDGDWTPGLRALSRATGSTAVGITFRAPGRPVVQHWLGLTEGFNAAYVSHYHRHDPWLIDGTKRSMLVTGAAYLGRELVSPSTLARNEVVQELHRSCGLGDLQAAILVGGRADDYLVSLGMMRPSDAPAFEGEDRDSLRQAIPYWRRALRIMVLRDRCASLPMSAAFWLDRCGRLVDLDLAARDLLADDDGILLSNGRLALFHPHEDRQLKAACARRGARAFLLASRRSARRAYLVAIVPAATGACVQVHDRDAVSEPPLDALRRWFGVTRAEAAVMLELARGKSPQELAETRDVAISTVRSQLRSIFAKTETRGQTEIAALVARLGLLRQS